MTEGEWCCVQCRPLAIDDCPGQPWRVDWRYRFVVNLHHGRRWHETGELGPHMDDPYLL